MENKHTIEINNKLINVANNWIFNFIYLSFICLIYHHTQHIDSNTFLKNNIYSLMFFYILNFISILAIDYYLLFIKINMKDVYFNKHLDLINNKSLIELEIINILLLSK